MLLFTQIAPLRAYLNAQKQLGKRIGFVPTMGALHQGHLSLIQLSKENTDLTVCSIFVNPTQFNNAEDLEKYPRTIEKDILLLEQKGCNVLFHPTADEMYPDGMEVKAYNWGSVTNTLEGFFRPGHFNGVIAIVKRLFEVVEPQMAFFGSKDYQQCAVVKRMCKEFHLPVTIVLGQTQREPDGLAMSSRNTRLTEQERKEALWISKALFQIEQGKSRSTPSQLLKEAISTLEKSPILKIEYIAIVDADTLEEVGQWVENHQCVALIAVWCGNVRLIDNIPLGE